MKGGFRKRLLRIDDITPGFPWKRFKKYAEELSDAGIRPLIGVVPANGDPSIDFESPTDDFWENVRELRSLGWTVAQHGYTHVYDSNAPTFLGGWKRSEFAGHSKSVQVDRINAGKIILQREGVWEPIFMAPNHAFDNVTMEALHSCDFQYVTDGWGLYPQRVGHLTLLPQLFASDLSLGVGVYSQCLHVGPMQQRNLDACIARVVARRKEYVSFAEAISALEPIPGLASLSRVVTRFAVPTSRRIRAWTRKMETTAL